MIVISNLRKTNKKKYGRKTKGRRYQTVERETSTRKSNKRNRIVKQCVRRKRIKLSKKSRQILKNLNYIVLK